MSTVDERQMTKTEREELKRLARERARVAKADTERRTADLKASFEHQVTTIYDYNRDSVWKEAHEIAKAAVNTAQETIEARCIELGIPRELSPYLTFGWQGRGQQGVARRQSDLRRAAYKQIEAMERTAKHEIDRKALEVQTQLVRAGLTSGEAVGFLETMPSVEALMPDIDLTALATRQNELSAGGDIGDDLF